MTTYGQPFNCENCNRQIIRGSKEDNMTELCDDCLSDLQVILEEGEKDIEEAF